MKHLMMALIGLFLVTSAYTQTCDLTLISQTPPATTDDDHSFVVEFVNAENCGCNEFTQTDGNTCDDSGSSSVSNNENVNHLVFGIHYVDEITGQDLGENTDCTSTTFHPGWSYTNVTNWGGWETGTTATININPPFAWECILATPLEGYCWEVVIWQINLSQTAGYDDFPFPWGWTVGNSFNQTQMYPDINIDDNRITECLVPCIPDTIIEYITDTLYIETIDTLYVTDTLYITETEIITDTLYITQNFTDTIYLTETEIIIDTLYLTEYITDTLYIDNFIYLTDTITQYITEEVWIDCITGLPCGDDPGYPCLGEGGIYVPNTFTPNNDGINDVWKLIYELECWVDVEFKIFNRWGALIYSGYAEEFDSYPYWDGSINNGSYYAQDGVYFYQLKGRKSDSPEIIEENGSITIFR
jgi:gliding motility-associated-like protein